MGIPHTTLAWRIFSFCQNLFVGRRTLCLAGTCLVVVIWYYKLPYFKTTSCCLMFTQRVHVVTCRCNDKCVEVYYSTCVIIIMNIVNSVVKSVQHLPGLPGLFRQHFYDVADTDSSDMAEPNPCDVREVMLLYWSSFGSWHKTSLLNLAIRVFRCNDYPITPSMHQELCFADSSSLSLNRISLLVLGGILNCIPVFRLSTIPWYE